MTLPTGHKTTLTRASIATKLAADGQSILPVVSGAARFEKVASGGVVVTDRGPGYPMDYDAGRGLILYVSADQQKLYAKAPPLGDLAAAPGQLILDVTDIAADMEAEGWVNITACRAMADGSWLLVIGRLGGYTDGAIEQCRIYRSTNPTATPATWTKVHHQHDGGNPGPTSPGVWGDRFVYGDYTGSADGVTHVGQHLWYTEDGFATEDEIWSKTTEAAGAHFHGARFDPAALDAQGNPTRIYAAFGDSADSIVMQLDRPVGWEPGDGAWGAPAILQLDLVPTQPESIAPFGGKLLVAGHDLFSLDPATGVYERLWRPPLPTETDDYARYSWNAGYNEWIRHVGVYNGVIYLSFCLYAPAANGQDGLYASADGVHWVALWRDIGNNTGLRVTNFVAQGRIYGYRNKGVGDDQVVSFPAVSPTLVNALRVERGETNIEATVLNSDLVGWVLPGNNNWHANPGEGHEKAVDGGMHGTECFRAYGTDTYCDMYVPRYNYFCSSEGGDTKLYAAPAVGKRVVVSVWLRVDVCPANWTWEIQFQGTGNAGIHWDDATAQRVGTEKWVQLIRTGIALDETPRRIKAIAVHGIGSTGAYDARIDAFKVLYLDDWAAGTSWQVGGTARANESASVSLAGYTAPWSLLFAWRPQGWAEFTADVPIVSLDGGGGVWVDLSYQVSTSRFLLKCGATEYTSGIVKFRHFDDLRFALSTSADGEDMQLFLWDPVGGAEQVGGEGIGLPGPVSARFGRDHTGALFGAGLFHSLGIRRAECSAGEFVQIVARPGRSWNRPLAWTTLVGAQR